MNTRRFLILANILAALVMALALVCRLALLETPPRPADAPDPVQVVTEVAAAPVGAGESRTTAVERADQPVEAVGTAAHPALSRGQNPVPNPYAAALRGPGKSKRAWDTGFIDRFQRAKNGDPVRFELTAGVMAEGVVGITRLDDGKITYVSGELTAPEPGRFFLLRPPAGGKAGAAVGVVEFPATRIAYRIEPTGPDGAPELWQRRLDEVICLEMPLPEGAPADGGLIEEIPLGQVPDYYPAYNTDSNGTGIISLQSLPGSSAVMLLDFFGGTTSTWGGVTYPAANVGNAAIKDLWKRVAEDYLPFNINVTTDINVYRNAPTNSRQRCVFTPSTSAMPAGAAGVAYVGSWNWGNDTVCWSIYTSGKSGAEVGAHEVGHTLGLGHETQEVPNGSGGTTHNEYYGGHGSGATGWAPIMGTGYNQAVTSWSKGEFQYASNFQDELNTIATTNNNVSYRADDTGDTLATSRYLEVYADFTASAEGVIERTGDTDAFQFTTTGGAVSLTANPVGDWSDLALTATLADAADTVIMTNNPQSGLAAGISTTLAAGTYTFRVTGAGRNNPLDSGFSSYASLGYYSISGSVAGARLPTRFTLAENTANGTVVGTVAARNNHGSAQLTWSITGGNPNNAFAVNPATGALTVANSTMLDYETLFSRWDDPADIELFVTIADATNPALNETIRTVVSITDVNEAPVMAASQFSVQEYASVGTVAGTVSASDPDRFDYVTYSIAGGDVAGLFAIDSSTGTIRVATTPHVFQDKVFHLIIRATDQGAPPLSTTSTCTVRVVNVNPKSANVLVACDNGYEMYLNGNPVGSGSNWAQAGQYQGLALNTGKNVIGIKGTDAGGVAALLAEVVTAGGRLGTASGWKVAVTPPSNWADAAYDDSAWAAATDYGAYGTAPWGTSVSGMPTDTPAHWIWSSNNTADDVAYFRYTVNVEPELTNDLPVIAQGASVNIAMSRDSFPVPFDLTLNASDPNGDVITWSVTSPAAHGAAVLTGSGARKAVGYKPASGFTGTDSFVVQAADGNGGMATVTVNVTVSAPTANIFVACDNGYELYLNGSLVGSGSNWQVAGQYQALALASGRNVIAIKGTDAGGVAALLAEIASGGKRWGTGSGWKVSLTAPSNWKSTTYDDSAWATATDYGAYGVSPWVRNASGMPTDTPARWIWSSNNDADNTVYFRYTLAPSTACDITDFAINGVSGMIDQNARTVVLRLPFGTALSGLVPTIAVSANATVAPASDATADFTATVPYTVTAQDGTTTKVYQVTVSREPGGTACNMLSFGLGGNAGLISGTAIAVIVPYGTNVTALAPVYTVSQDATGSPVSGTTRDFTTPQTYVVTAQDGTTRQTYTVTVEHGAAPGGIATVPPGLPAGTKYRLAFVTSDVSFAMSAAIGDYNAFVTTAANAVPVLAGLGTTWTCIGSTQAVNARANTLTRASDPSWPIHNLSGLQVASGNTDLWDGALSYPISVTEHGDDTAVKAWTGTLENGATPGEHMMGDPNGGYVYFGISSSTSPQWSNNLGDQKWEGGHHLYAISGTLMVPTALEKWRLQYFGTAANTGTAADGADFDNDGEANLLEFATGQNPSAQTRTATALARNGANLEFTYTRANAALAGGIVFSVEWSDTLAGGSWSVAGVSAPVVLSDNGTTQQVRVAVETGTGTKRFLRLKATLP